MAGGPVGGGGGIGVNAPKKKFAGILMVRWVSSVGVYFSSLMVIVDVST